MTKKRISSQLNNCKKTWPRKPVEKCKKKGETENLETD